jgi:hypothetical protein
MDFVTFAEKSKETMKEGDSYEIDLYHAASGIVTEIKELQDAFTDINTIEELGDICWFLSLIHKRIPFDFGGGIHTTASREHTLNILMVNSIGLLDNIKKHVQYDKENQGVIKTICNHISTIILQFCYQSGYNIQTVFSANIAKLQKKRYKSGYNNYDAINRNTREEYDAMENEE